MKSTPKSTLTIDWQWGKWRVVSGGRQLGQYDEIHINAPCRLVHLTAGHGVLEVTARLRTDGGRAIIEE